MLLPWDMALLRNPMSLKQARIGGALGKRHWEICDSQLSANRVRYYCAHAIIWAGSHFFFDLHHHTCKLLVSDRKLLESLDNNPKQFLCYGILYVRISLTLSISLLEKAPTPKNSCDFYAQNLPTNLKWKRSFMLDVANKHFMWFRPSFQNGSKYAS